MNAQTRIIIEAAISSDASINASDAEKALALLDGGAAPVADEPLTASEAAELLKCTRRTVTRYANGGLIKRIGGRGAGSMARYSRKSIISYLNGKAA